MQLKELTTAIARSLSPDQRTISGLVGSSRAAVVAALAEITPNLLVITASAIKAERLKQECSLFSARPPVIFPALDVLPGEELLPSKELVGERLTVVEGWRRGDKQVVIAPLKAVRQKTTSRPESVNLKVDQEIRLDTLIGKLVDLGYKRYDIVGERGEFSIRGGIVDIFPINSPAAFRLELDADRIGSLRRFDPYSQRSNASAKEALILPAREKSEEER